MSHSRFSLRCMLHFLCTCFFSTLYFFFFCGICFFFVFFFFFQAEDGIRDADVTGVQTCALPILDRFEAPDAAKSIGLYTMRIYHPAWANSSQRDSEGVVGMVQAGPTYDTLDRKSTRLNSSHVRISYAVFCLKKKK